MNRNTDLLLAANTIDLAAPRLRGARLSVAVLLAALLLTQVAVAADLPSIVWRWEETGPLAQERAGHTATLLNDGRVLVVGDLGLSATTAELYDPASHTWSETEPLATPRYGHTATLLSDGRVLVAGGMVDPYQVHRAVEIFDPATEAWTAAAEMPTARAFHAAALLPDGSVLLIGGGAGTSGTNAVERYDPATDTWTFSEGMNKGRIHHTATVLADGRVLVVGGYLPGNVAELYDPATGRWRFTGGRAVAFLEGHVAVRLDDGRIFVVGLNEAGVYDPAAETWTAQDSPAMGEGFAAAPLGDGRVMISGGYEAPIFPPVTFFHDTTVLVDPTTWEWEFVAWMNWGRAGHTLTRLADGSVLAAGGLENTNSAEVFRAIELPYSTFIPSVLFTE